MNIPQIVIALIALCVASAGLLSGMQRRSNALKFSRTRANDLLRLQPKRIFDTVNQCAKYLRIPPERVLDLNEPMESEDPLPPGYGLYIPTNVMITQHLQGATRRLWDANSAFIDNDISRVWQCLASIEQSLGWAIRGKELRDAEATALAETQLALQAFKQ